MTDPRRRAGTLIQGGHPIPAQHPGTRPGTRRLAAVLVAAAVIALPSIGHTQTMRNGYLCCNLWTYNDWISDINYKYEDSKLLRAGLPIRAIEPARYSYKVFVGGRERRASTQILLGHRQCAT